ETLLVDGCVHEQVGGPPTETHKRHADAQEGANTPHSKWQRQNAPGHHPGAIYRRDELRALADVLARHPHVWLMTDDIYARLNFTDSPTVHPLQAAPELAERALVVNGVSKAYAMTGWRIGYGAGPAALIRAMAILQSQS